MNPEIKTTEYLAKLTDIKLSQSARARIEDNLIQYATFHSVREVGNDRFIKQVPVTTSTLLLSLRYSFMPLILILAIVIGGTTTFAAQNTVPGDFLYPVKTEFNENIRTAFAFSDDSGARVQTALLEERIEEAQTLHTEGRLSAETATQVSANITNQFAVARNASAKSSESVAAETNLRAKQAITTFLALEGLDAKFTAKVSTVMQASDLATGLYSITAYQADMQARSSSLKNILVQYQAKLNANVYTNLTTKITTAIALTAEAATQIEDDARLTLDKAATLAGEVEAKLSTLGQVDIDSDTGIITAIDFSIDPMKIDRGDGETKSQTTPSTQENYKGETEVKSENSIESSLESNTGKTKIESDASITSGVEVDL